MGTDRFYHTDCETSKSILLLNNYKELESACYNIHAPRLLIIDTEKKEFWTSDQQSLDDCKQITHLHYQKQIIQTTSKEIESWLN